MRTGAAMFSQVMAGLGPYTRVGVREIGCRYAGASAVVGHWCTNGLGIASLHSSGVGSSEHSGTSATTHVKKSAGLNVSSCRSASRSMPVARRTISSSSPDIRPSAPVARQFGHMSQEREFCPKGSASGINAARRTISSRTPEGAHTGKRAADGRARRCM